jgi:tRNA(Ile)-lysidine synthase
MAGPDPAVAAVRRAVRTALAATPPQSLALLAGLAWEAPRHDRRAAAVHVDHGLHPGSAAQAANVTQQAADLGLDTHVRAVTPDGTDENAARTARYAALDGVVTETGASVVLLGHTRDDQAEQVLLGLARGSGARSLAGMPRTRGAYARPLLDLPRATTEAACAAQGLTPWQDPANGDPRFARSRVRHAVLPAMEAALGPGVAAALARTADLLRADADALDALAAEHAHVRDADALAALPAAIRTRVLRRAAIDSGCPPTDLTAAHVAAIDRLVTDWHGQGQVDLPGGLAAVRRCGTLAFPPGFQP